jgi:hypothetical protein
MDNRIGSGHQPAELRDRRQVAADELATEVAQNAGSTRLSDRGDDVIASGAQLPDDRRADEPGTTGDKDPYRAMCRGVGPGFGLGRGLALGLAQ